jgi:hypothetical protein
MISPLVEFTCGVWAALDTAPLEMASHVTNHAMACLEDCRPIVS